MMNKHDDSSEEATKLDEDILTTTKQLQNVMKPDEVKLDGNIANNAKVNELYDMIKNMPRENVMQLMANMAKSSKLPKHNFIPVTDPRRDELRLKLQKKLENLKLKKIEEERKKLSSEKTQNQIGCKMNSNKTDQNIDKSKEQKKLSRENNKTQNQVDCKINSNKAHQNNDKSEKPKKIKKKK